ncbi:MAG TPA: hypothetical protein VFN14_00715 [Candidatus Limnocylindria bacterium]|nr:hypothetical protein [Candidatus Limnocylindria bacterium]
MNTDPQPPADEHPANQHPPNQDNRPPVIDRHQPPAKPQRTGPMGSIEGADRAGLGIDAEPEPAPVAAQVDPSKTHVPGPAWGDLPATDRKPWQTTLATKSDDAGIGAKPDPEGEI